MVQRKAEAKKTKKVERFDHANAVVNRAIKKQGRGKAGGGGRRRRKKCRISKEMEARANRTYNKWLEKDKRTFSDSSNSSLDYWSLSSSSLSLSSSSSSKHHSCHRKGEATEGREIGAGGRAGEVGREEGAGVEKLFDVNDSTHLI